MYYCIFSFKIFVITCENPYGAKRTRTADPLHSMQINNLAITRFATFSCQFVRRIGRREIIFKIADKKIGICLIPKVRNCKQYKKLIYTAVMIFF